MKKYIANIISFSRIIAAVFLFFFSEITNAFLTIYVYCGFTDFIDGPIARKLDSESVFGSIMDTAGDVLTYLALAKVLIVQNLLPFWFYLWEGLAVIMFLISATISKIKSGNFYFVHSFFGKIMGTSMFVLPFAMRFFKVLIWIGVICAVSNIAAIESIIIQAKQKKLPEEEMHNV
ncbi:MAG: CDP-alcohol phosphatidyltransferase family protein [Eubacterium sp.]|nr:CDP-alcohol phosphatidyltransferase family protein [Eubacterium sp.]